MACWCAVSLCICSSSGIQVAIHRYAPVMVRKRAHAPTGNQPGLARYFQSLTESEERDLQQTLEISKVDVSHRTEETITAYRVLDERLESYGCRRQLIAKDGNCLFRCFAAVAWHSEDQHLLMRSQVAEFMSNFKAPLMSVSTSGRKSYMPDIKIRLNCCSSSDKP